jgi:hypothetical protein
MGGHSYDILFLSIRNYGRNVVIHPSEDHEYGTFNNSANDTTLFWILKFKCKGFLEAEKIHDSPLVLLKC